jgi:hypothetical protein
MKFQMTTEDIVAAKPDSTRADLRGVAPETWRCLDCGVDTAPGCLAREELEQAFAAAGKHGSVEQTIDDRSEVYTVRETVWKRAGVDVHGGCLCIGCLEQRLGRRLKPKDFPRDNPFNQLPGSARLMKRRGR